MPDSKLDYFCSNTSLHGFKYLAGSDAPLWKKTFSRLFWSCCILTSIYLMFFILSRSMHDFSAKATSINLDTNYRDWNNTFPAVSICMTKGRSTTKIKNYLEDYWSANNMTTPPRAIRFFRAIQSLMFINYHQPQDGVSVDGCMELNETCGIDIDITKRALLPQKCEDFMFQVTFLGKSIPCEEVFKLHRTEIGHCFTANSLYSNGKDLRTLDHLPLRHSNQDVVERSLEIQYKDIEFVIYKLYIHTPEELPHGSLEGFGLRKSRAHTYMAFKTTEMKNQEDVKDQDIEARNCRFPEEFLSYEHKLPYCVANCHFYNRMTRELKDCGCTLPLGEVPEKVTVCNITRFECIGDSNMRYHNIDESLKDRCTTPTCLAMEIVTIGSYEKELDEPVGVLIIDILNKPSLRYLRRVRVTKLDMIVQVGGIVGLFLGASILSLIEIFFLLIDVIRRRK